jgi:hypothetical protein
VSDINTVVADSLKVLDPKRPIREADITMIFLSTQRYIVVIGRDGVVEADAASKFEEVERGNDRHPSDIQD